MIKKYNFRKKLNWIFVLQPIIDLDESGIIKKGVGLDF
jgi:hypothetical protein